MNTRIGRAVASTSIAVLAGSSSWAQLTQRVDVATDGSQANAWCEPGTFSPDGRYIVFGSGASNLVAGDTNFTYDVFVRDRQTGTTEIVSLSSTGALGDGDSGVPAVSAGGRFVVFSSTATNLVPGDTNGVRDIFVRDRLLGSTERVSVATDGSQANAESGIYLFTLAISDDGRYVTFDTTATNLAPGDTNGQRDVFVRDRLLGTTELVSVSTVGTYGNGDSEFGQVSADGRYVTFESNSSDLVAGDTNGKYDAFVRDLQTGMTERISVATGGAQANNDNGFPQISTDGRFVAFLSWATNMVAGDTNAAIDVFVHDRVTGTTERVSVANGGVQQNADAGIFGLSISGDGRYVAFESGATNLVQQDTNGFTDVFVRDRLNGTTERVSVATSGLQSNSSSLHAVISRDGRFALFTSLGYTLVPFDTNEVSDLFIRDRNAAGFTSTCDAGVASVIACPCANPPSQPGRGCDNSSATGGAELVGRGVAYLTDDSLVFTTTGEKPTATSIVMQGDGEIANGIVFGQGVRCVGGSLKRLYLKTAVNGEIQAPDFGVGDLPVSQRSAALGSTIQAGESRWYLVYYRDPTVLGGCSAASTFNATQTGRVDWSL